MISYSASDLTPFYGLPDSTLWEGFIANYPPLSPINVILNVAGMAVYIVVINCVINVVINVAVWFLML